MPEPRGPLSRFLARGEEDPVKIVGVTLAVGLACALTVSAASVLLAPYQQAHLEAERAARMAAMLDALPGMEALLEEAGADALTTRLVDLSTGEYARGLDPATYDAAADPGAAVPIPAELDIAGLGARAPYAPVHVLDGGGRTALVVLPVSGRGYQSTIRALLALEADLSTVAALTITDQAETPGLGTRIEDPGWQALWPGTHLADETGALAITVVRGGASEPWEVDGIAGATRTGDGVGAMVRYWLGPHGYGPFLDRLRREGGA